MKMNKKGVSPVIATVLLIVITIILGGIVFVWANGFFGETITKNGEPAENSCGLISFEAQYIPASKELQINNKANIPIYGFEIKTSGSGSANVQELFEATIGLGESKKFVLSGLDMQGVTQITLIPVIIGQKGDTPQPFTCPESSAQTVSVV